MLGGGNWTEDAERCSTWNVKVLTNDVVSSEVFHVEHQLEAGIWPRMTVCPMWNTFWL